MRKIEIYAIHYDTPSRQQAPFGGISKEFVCGRDDTTGDNIVNLGTYADMRAPYWIWKNRDDYDIIGFHGYRKFLDFFKPPEYGKPRWHDVNLMSLLVPNIFRNFWPSMISSWRQRSTVRTTSTWWKTFVGRALLRTGR